MPPHDCAALILADGMLEQDGENLDETLQLLVGSRPVSLSAAVPSMLPTNEPPAS